MNNELMNKIYFNYKKSLTLSNKHKNKLIDILKSPNFLIAINPSIKKDLINPTVFPIADTSNIAFMLFENEDSLKNFEKENELENTVEALPIDRDVFYIIIQELYLKGITGVLLNGVLDDEYTTLYYPILELVNYEQGAHSIKRLYTYEKQEIITILNYLKIKKKTFSYIYRKDLTGQEVALFIVKYHIFEEHNYKNIKLFLEEIDADKYCKKNDLIANEEPRNTTVHNDILFGTLYNLGGKVDDVCLYANNKEYKLPLVEFVELLAGVGFEQIDLSGKK